MCGSLKIEICICTTEATTGTRVSHKHRKAKQAEAYEHSACSSQQPPPRGADHPRSPDNWGHGEGRALVDLSETA